MLCAPQLPVAAAISPHEPAIWAHAPQHLLAQRVHAPAHRVSLVVRPELRHTMPAQPVQPAPIATARPPIPVVRSPVRLVLPRPSLLQTDPPAERAAVRAIVLHDRPLHSLFPIAAPISIAASIAVRHHPAAPTVVDHHPLLAAATAAEAVQAEAATVVVPAAVAVADKTSVTHYTLTQEL